jgi:hypothetical protein
VEPDGTLREMHPVDAARSDYVARSPALETDLYISSIDFMWQRVAAGEIRGVFDATRQGFHSLATSVAKIDFVYERGRTLGLAGADFIATEVDYVLILARRVFDHLHELISRIWSDRVELKDPESEKRRRQRSLPKSFAKFALKDGAPRPSHDLVEHYALPQSYAEACENTARFFAEIKSARDEIVHGLGRQAAIFRTERGWCVDPTEKPFTSFQNVWTKDHRFSERLVSLRPLLAYVVVNTIASCCTLLESFAAEVTFPEPMAPEHHIFVRGLHNESLVGLLRLAKGGDPWWPAPGC